MPINEPVPGGSGTQPRGESPIEQAARLSATDPRSTVGLMFGAPKQSPRPEAVRAESGSSRRWWQFWKSPKAETPRNTEPTMPEATQPAPITPRP